MALLWWIYSLLVACSRITAVSWEDGSEYCVMYDDDEEKTCECINDEMNLYYGQLYCAGLHITHFNDSVLHKDECRHVYKASLQANRLTSYPTFLRDKRFRKIRLSSNLITSPPRAYELSANVTFLDISWNQISNTTNEMRSMISLEALYVGWNSLITLGFLPNPCKLQFLDASHNHIESIEKSVKRCVSLQTLELSNNNLKLIPRKTFKTLRNLNHLDLSDNPLTVIAPGTFIGLKHLTFLQLRNVEITHVSKRTFTGLTQLNYLSISENPHLSLSKEMINAIRNISREVFFGHNFTAAKTTNDNEI